MESFYRLLDWLTMAQAVDWLNSLTGSPITDAGLMQLCAAGKCRAFINTNLATRTDLELNSLLCGASGYHQVLNVEQLIPTLGGMGRYTVEAIGQVGGSETTWAGLFPVHTSGIFFQTADIEALATRMKTLANQPCQVEVLREELAKARSTSRELAKKLETTERVCAVSQEESYELRSQAELDCQIHYLEVKELREKLEQEIRPPLERKLAELDNELALTNSLLQQAQQQAKERPPHLLAIAGLLGLLLDHDRPRFTQGSAAAAIDSKGWGSASESMLTKLFAEANRAAKEADKDARPKLNPRELAVTKASKA